MRVAAGARRRWIAPVAFVQVHSGIEHASLSAVDLCGFGLTLAGFNSSDGATPNVLLIITDDQGYGDIGFHGNAEIHTPSIDALARSSLRLTNFHVDPTCAETRAALMTGRYAMRGGVWHTIMGRSILSKESVTLPQLFKAAGYRTGIFGKWHLGDNYPYRPQDRGFDQTLHLGGGGVGQSPDVWGNDYFDDVYWSADQLKPVRGYCTDVFFHAASQFIDSQAGKPFFCYLATNAAHAPYNVPQSYKQPYLDQGIEEPRASFYGMITNIDDNIGRMLKLLDDRGLAENTIVIFMTDNGTAAGYVPPGPRGGKPKGYNAGMRAMKGSQFEGGHRVPCFIRYGRELPTDRDVPMLCAHFDLLPTLARLCHLDTSSITKLDGIDLVDEVKKVRAWPERSLVVQSHRVEEPEPLRKSAVMRDRWRLIDGRDLYDIQADPGQANPLDAAVHSDVSRMLLADYQTWWKDMKVDPNRYANIMIGAQAAPRVRLTAHDWHGPQPVWSQPAVEKDPAVNGFWAVEVQQAGAYQFLLSRRPLEAPAPIEAVKAKLDIGDVQAEINIEPTAVLAPITVRLQPGVTKLTTELLGSDGTKRGAYFATVNYLGDVSQATINAAQKQLPPWLHAGDRIAWLGGTLIERAAPSGALEAEVLLRAPYSGLTFVNLGWSGDDFTGRARAVFGTATDGKTRRLNDVALSGASLVVIAYGMSELLDASLSEARLKSYESELRELIGALRSQGRRTAICLPPQLHHDIEGTAAQPMIRAMCDAYAQRRPMLVSMLQNVATTEQLPTIELPAVQSSYFESGTYLSQSGYKMWAASFAEALFPNASVQSRANEEQLREQASDCQRLFFDMHRPQNETYLLLFRKHEQGNNAVELGQFRPLLADKQLELLQTAGSAP